MTTVDQNQTTVRTIALTEGPLSPGTGYIDSRTDFDRNSRAVRMVDDDNDASLAEYDGANRTVKTTDPAGNTVETFYDKNSNVVETKETDVSASAASEVFLTTNKFDSLNRLILSADNLGQATRMRYDSRNNAIETTDGQGYVTSATITRVSSGAVVSINDDGNKTQYHYDGLNRRTSSEMFITTTGNGGDPLDTTNPSNPDGKITLTQTWDKNSRLKTQVDDKGNTTTYDYDALNRRFKTTYADSSFEQTTFDANDNVATYTDENGTVRTCSYDQINRLTQCSVVRATGVLGTTLQTREYDGLSRKTLCTDNNDPADGTDDSTVTMAYDSLSRLLEEAQSISDGSSAKAVSSNWQANDHRVGLVYPNGRELSYTFDDLDRYLQVGDVTNPSLSPVATYGYIGYRVLTRTYKNGTKLSYLNSVSGLDDGYDGLRRVVIQRHVDASNAVVAQFSHVYNRTNNRLNEIREHHLDGGLRVGEAYAYDSLYRLTNFQVGTFTAGGVFNTPSGSQQWQLDGVGNWALFTDNGTPKMQTINSVNEYTSFAGTTNAFDANKNLTDDGTFLYAFDFLNRLREVRRKSDNALIATYLYDSNGSAHLMGAGRRIRKITTADSSVGASMVLYSYDGIMCIEERDASDAVLRQYVNGQRIDEHLSMDTYTSGSISATHYYHENALGNVIALTDGTGSVVERYTYQAYGLPEFRDAANVQQSIVQSAVGNPFLFNGQRFDPETGLSYYRHRYLNHAQGRFVNKDPVGFDHYSHLFAYVTNNPITYGDKSGMNGGPMELGEDKKEEDSCCEDCVISSAPSAQTVSQAMQGGWGWNDYLGDGVTWGTTNHKETGRVGNQYAVQLIGDYKGKDNCGVSQTIHIESANETALNAIGGYLGKKVSVGDTVLEPVLDKDPFNQKKWFLRYKDGKVTFFDAPGNFPKESKVELHFETCFYSKCPHSKYEKCCVTWKLITDFTGKNDTLTASQVSTRCVERRGEKSK